MLKQKADVSASAFCYLVNFFCIGDSALSLICQNYKITYFMMNQKTSVKITSFLTCNWV